MGWGKRAEEVGIVPLEGPSPRYREHLPIRPQGVGKGNSERPCVRGRRVEFIPGNPHLSTVTGQVIHNGCEVGLWAS